MPKHERNVRLHALPPGARRPLERLLVAHPRLHRFLAYSAQLTLATLIWPRFGAPFHWELTRHNLPVAGLDPAFHGYRILQLTDLHVGKTRLSYLHRAIDRCLDERPDLIALTGDLIDYYPTSLAPLAPLLKRIVSRAGPDGVCAIFGNHDYHEYSWRHNGQRSARRIIHRRLVQIVQDAGITLLRNQQLPITRPTPQGAARITVVGLDEMWTGRADAPAAFRGLTPTDPVICLQHNPDGIDFLLPFPWQFMLCGHSHGGQARFPLLGALVVPMQHRQYLRGFFHFPPLPGSAAPRRTMFVSRGLGYSHPIRLRCRPEATIFTLTPVS